MAMLSEKETVTTYTLELTEKEAKALQYIVGVFWPTGVVGDICAALDEGLGEPTIAPTTAYDGSVFDGVEIETDITYVLDEKAL